MSRVLRERCQYTCGPYKGYLGRAEYDSAAEVFHGEVVGTRDVITFQAGTPSDLRAAFVGSVDDYLDFCRQRGEKPEKPFSGKFVARIRPELHRQISLLAKQRGTSLNALVEQCLSKALKATRAKTLTGSLGKKAKKSTKPRPRRKQKA